MARPSLYTTANVERASYAGIGVAVIAVALCGYFIISTLLSIQKVTHAERLKSSVALQSATLSREVANLRKQAADQEPGRSGGVEEFAMQVSRWARENRVNVESLTPEGTPTTADIKVDDAKLGVWNAHRVRVEGRGRYSAVKSFLNEFRNPSTPIRLDSFALQTVDSGTVGVVGFNILLTIYEKKGRAA